MDAAGHEQAVRSSSSNPSRTSGPTAGAPNNNKQKQKWVETNAAASGAAADLLHSTSSASTMTDSSSYYSLFPEPGSGKGLQLHGLFSAHHQRQPQPQPQLKLKQPAMPEVDSSNELLTPSHPEVYRTGHPDFPIKGQRHPTDMEFLVGDKEYDMATVFPQGICSGSSQAMDPQNNNANETIGLNIQEQMNINAENTRTPGAPDNVEQDSKDSTPLNEIGRKQLSHIIAVQEAYARAIFDPDQITAGKLFQQSIQDLRKGYCRDVLVAHYADNPADADTTVLRPRFASSSFSQTQQRGGTSNPPTCGGFHNMAPNIPVRFHQQRQIVPPTNNTLRLISIKGQLAAYCSNMNGSHLVQQALEVATPEEIAMAYKEIMPNIRALAVDIYANRALQKLLEHGPQSYKRELISHLIGHVLDLSLHMYGCRVIQKALEVGELDQKILMAKELRREVHKCVRDQFANHVIQKCMECVPARHIQFIFRSFCRNAKVLSTHPYGCRVIQKVLTFCNNPEIYDTLTREIVEFASELSSHPFGNYVVQHLLEHGSPAKRSMVVKLLCGQMVRMSYHKFASNVVEKCLTFGSQHDRQLITDEIISAGGRQHFHHITDMMTNPYANFVIQKLIQTAEETQVGVLVEVARSNLTTLTRYTHGRHAIAAIESHLSAKAARLVLLTDDTFHC